MRTRLVCAAAFVSVLGCALPAIAQVDQERAQAFFKEAQALCEREGGRLWGVSLCGPMVIGDAPTKTFATSQPAPDAPRPPIVGLVNAPVQWGGATWASYMWYDLSNAPPQARNEVLIHELFHGVQPRLGLMVQNPASEHLDAQDGRYWMRLEWRALARALRESGPQRSDAVRDALAFRQARHCLRPTPSRARSAGWRSWTRRRASSGPLRTRRAQRTVCSSMRLRPTGGRHCAAPTISRCF